MPCRRCVFFGAAEAVAVDTPARPFGDIARTRRLPCLLIQHAREWAASRGLQLDELLTMRDEGLAASREAGVNSGTTANRNLRRMHFQAIENRTGLISARATVAYCTDLPMASILSTRMNKKTLIFARMLCFSGCGLTVHFASAQDAPENMASIVHRSTLSAAVPASSPRLESIMRFSTVTPAVPQLPESVGTQGMMSRGRSVVSPGSPEKDVRELVAEHPELQTHSHTTYYNWSLHVGERTRLQPPGSEFAHQ